MKMARQLESDLRRALGEGADAADGGGGAELGRWLAERADADGLLDIAYAPLDTPLGVATVAATERGLLRVMLPNEDRDTSLQRLAREVSPRILEAPVRVDAARRELDEYFAGRRRAFDLGLDLQLVHADFYRRVLQALRKVHFGETLTYGEIAARAGNPRAHRAAGTAVGSNPLPIVVPCHRVIRAGGEIGNYGGGPEMKRYLLELEGALPVA
jgi:methylated-DNA-[protein]-cysteine S-methyltransferase